MACLAVGATHIFAPNTDAERAARCLNACPPSATPPPGKVCATQLLLRTDSEVHVVVPDVKGGPGTTFAWEGNAVHSPAAQQSRTWVIGFPAFSPEQDSPRFCSAVSTAAAAAVAARFPSLDSAARHFPGAMKKSNVG